MQLIRGCFWLLFIFVLSILELNKFQCTYYFDLLTSVQFTKLSARFLGELYFPFYFCNFFWVWIWTWAWSRWLVPFYKIGCIKFWQGFSCHIILNTNKRGFWTLNWSKVIKAWLATVILISNSDYCTLTVRVLHYIKLDFQELDHACCNHH